MKKLILLVLIFSAVALAYFEQNDGVPGIYSSDGSEKWLLWAGRDKAATLFDGSSGILFSDGNEAVVVGKFTPGDARDRLTVVGYFAGWRTVGASSSAFGARAGWYNTGNFHTSLGSFSGQYNDGIWNTSLGADAFTTFTVDTDNAQDITSVDPNDNRVGISGGHGFGANGTFKNLKASTTDTLPAGLISTTPEVWEIISSTVLECFSDSFTDEGVGTHTLTPQFIYTNSTAVGFNAEPDASHQVMLGDTNVTEVKTAGGLTVAGTITSGNITILSPTPILVFKDNNSLGAASVGFIEWRDSGGGRAGFLGNHTSSNDDLLWKNEQGGNIGIQTTGAGEFQIFANTVIPDDGTIGSVSDPDAIKIEADGDVVMSQDLSVAGGADFDTDTLVVDAVNHRVGVGISPTAGKLHIKQSAQTRLGGIILEKSNAASKNAIYLGAGNSLIFDISDGGGLLAILPTGNVGILELAPETLLEMTSTVPYLTLHNSTEENSDGGRESRINFKGEQGAPSAGTETTLARIEASHDGAADDEKGKFVISVNDGDDGDTPTDRFKIDAAGITHIGDGTNENQFSATGLQTFHGTARVFRSVDFEPEAVKQGGVGPGASTEDAFPIHDYSAANDESVFIHWEIPHTYASAGEIHLHVEYFVDTAPIADANVTWGVEYKKLSIGDNFDFDAGTTTVIVNDALTTGTPANDKSIHSSDEIHLVTTGFEPMDVVLIRIFRDANASEVGATDDFGSDARVFNYHLMFLSDKDGQGS